VELRVIRVREASSAEWDAALAASPSAVFFQSRQWAEAWAAARVGEYRPGPMLLGFSDGAHAVVPMTLARTTRGLLRKALFSPAGTYGGWLGEGLSADHASLLALCMVRHASAIWWRVSPYEPFPPAVEGLPSGVAFEPETTDALDLTAGFDAVRSGFSRGHRSAANKGRRLGVEVSPARSTAEWRAYLALYDESLRRWGGVGGVADYPARLYEELRRITTGQTLWLARYEGRVVAGALCFSTPLVTVYWHGATDTAVASLRPSTLLIEEIVRDACGNGRSWFDFNPSGGLAGVREFKRRFGTQPLDCPVVTWTRRLAGLAGRLHSARRRCQS